MRTAFKTAVRFPFCKLKQELNQMKHFALASLLGYFASAETCTPGEDTMSSCYSDLLSQELEMFRKLEEQDEEMGASLTMSRPTKLNQI